MISVHRPIHMDVDKIIDELESKEIRLCVMNVVIKSSHVCILSVIKKYK